MTRSKDDVKGQIDTMSLDSETVDKIQADKSNCPHSLMNLKDCHNHNFGNYCTKKVKWYFYLFSTAVSCQRAKEFSIRKYHSAFHVLLWLKHNHLADKGTFQQPTSCLWNTMKDVCEEVNIVHHKCLIRHNWRNIADWKEKIWILKEQIMVENNLFERN